MSFTYDLILPNTLGISSASSFYVSYSVTGETIDAPLLMFSVSQGNNLKAILSHGYDKENKAFDTYVLPKGYSNSVGFLASGLNTTRLSEEDGTLTVTVNWNGWLAQWFDSGEFFIVREDRSTTDTLWPDDEIILTTDTLFDGQVVGD